MWLAKPLLQVPQSLNLRLGGIVMCGMIEGDESPELLNTYVWPILSVSPSFLSQPLRDLEGWSRQTDSISRRAFGLGIEVSSIIIPSVSTSRVCSNIIFCCQYTSVVANLVFKRVFQSRRAAQGMEGVKGKAVEDLEVKAMPLLALWQESTVSFERFVRT
jgi:hypothetical protein